MIDSTYRMVVMQPTNYCNANCTYCYLPNRRDTAHMQPAVAQAIARDIEEQGEPVTVLWHSGEPTSVGTRVMRQLLDPFENGRGQGLVRHHIQTNATLIGDGWCRLFDEYAFEIGVSLDGPAWLCTERVNWAGRPIHAQAVEGIRRLMDAGLNPYAICVVPPFSTGRGVELLTYFDDLGLEAVAFNLEASLGISTTRSVPADEAARRFWTDVLTWCRAHPDRIRVRELLQAAAFVQRTMDKPREPMPTVGRDGTVVLASPELAGLRAPVYNDFRAGNVLEEPLTAIIGRQHELGYIAEFEKGLEACRATCGFWEFCHGGFAAMRYAEHGRMDTTRTQWCTAARIELARALADQLDGDTTSRTAQAFIPLMERTS
ncbi:radical SAM protein [Streptomyces sp. NPDC001404]|uniref:radical SAM protein n=1 Tax=Streptomyces sp. NPDC001404 TaxID=3364571 RepID=UPI003684147E